MRIAAIVALGALMLSSASAFAQEQEGESAPPKRYPPSSVRPKLIAGGLVVSGLAYGGALIGASAMSDLAGASELQIPIVGPWISLGKIDCPATDKDCGVSLYLRGALIAIDGLMQIGGLGIVGEGLFMTTEAAPTSASKRQALQIRPAPILTGTTTGIGIVGTF